MTLRDGIIIGIAGLVVVTCLEGCYRETTETTTATTVTQNSSITQVCGRITDKSDNLRCTVDVMVWLAYENAIEPTRIQGGI